MAKVKPFGPMLKYVAKPLRDRGLARSISSPVQQISQVKLRAPIQRQLPRPVFDENSQDSACQMHQEYHAKNSSNPHFIRRGICGIIAIRRLPGVITGNIRVTTDATVTRPFNFKWANKAHGGRTTLHQFIAKFLTRQNLFPGSRNYFIVYQLVARRVHVADALVFGAQGGICRWQWGSAIM